MFPGLYLIAILFSATGIAILDWRFRLAAWAPHGLLPTVVAVAVTTGLLLITDVVAIALGVFLQGSVAGDSPLYLGISVGPELPIEEPFFLAFLSYLAIVVWSAALRGVTRVRAPRHGERR